MKNTTLFISFVAALCAVPALAADGGTDAGIVATDAGAVATDAGTVTTDAGTAATDAGTVTGCGNLNILGECVGTTLRYCNSDNVLVESDCAAAFPDATATCGEISANWGFDCMLDDGQVCIYNNANGQPFAAFCQTGSGCFSDIDAQTNSCESGQGSCTSSDNFAAECNGDHLTFGCNEGQRSGVVCPAGSTCTAGACTGVAVDGSCDGQLLVCASGLTCTSGKCIEGSTNPDAGTSDNDDAGTSGSEPEPSPTEDEGCSATGVPSSSIPASFALLALLGVAIRRRR